MDRFDSSITETLRQQCDKVDIEAARKDFNEVMSRHLTTHAKFVHIRRILNNLRMCWRLGQD